MLESRCKQFKRFACPCSSFYNEKTDDCPLHYEFYRYSDNSLLICFTLLSFHVFSFDNNCEIHFLKNDERNDLIETEESIIINRNYPLLLTHENKSEIIDKLNKFTCLF